MKCPNDDTTLVMTERQGIEIDYCPECRGVWLDRGELDKIIERSSADAPAAAAPAPQAPPAGQPQSQGYPPQGFQQGYGQQNYGHGRHGHKRRKHWLEEIFD